MQLADWPHSLQSVSSHLTISLTDSVNAATPYDYYTRLVKGEPAGCPLASRVSTFAVLRGIHGLIRRLVALHLKFKSVFFIATLKSSNDQSKLYTVGNLGKTVADHLKHFPTCSSY